MIELTGTSYWSSDDYIILFVFCNDMILKRNETKFGKLMVRDGNQLKTKQRNIKKDRFDKIKDVCHTN